MLDPNTANWWISGNGSMPLGMGGEELTFELGGEEGEGGGGGLRRLRKLELKIPPLPQGPLSVRDFEVFTTTESEIDGPWDLVFEGSTSDTGELQVFDMPPETDARFIKFVCRKTAERWEVEKILAEVAMRPLPTEELEGILQDQTMGISLHTSVGLFYLRLS